MKRKTTQRTALEQVFLEEDHPLTIEQILACGRRTVETLNQATVYRTIKLLLDQGAIRQIHHPGLGTLYERADKAHHHHFYCRVCRRVYDLPGCMLDKQQAAPAGYVVEDHEYFLTGVCPACRQGAEARPVIHE